ncbi:tetratricopeptide repeat protein [Chloroherpeton thalassium]|uniref:tetratricopeptide repeat protein n=1 Tax=Chloroherpeton thalassium TaxID=100716 RepID=UPI0002E92D92|nr:tetratricopeptide repeat protein [Chloroherpeton thalassium]
MLFISVGSLSAKSRNHQQQSKDRERESMLHFVNGALFEAKQQYSQAILEYEDALEYSPKEPAIFFSIAKAYKNLDNQASAITYAKKATELDSTNKWYSDLLGQLYFDTREFEKAAEQYLRITNKDPNDISALYMLANSYNAANQAQKAIEVYNKIIDIVGFEMDVLSQKFLLHVQLKQYDSAIMTLQDMIIVDPENLELYRTLGDMYIRSGRYQDAIRAYQDVLNIEPTDFKALVALGETYLKLQDFVNFSVIIKKVFSLHSFEVEDKLGVAEMYFRRIETDTNMVKPTLLVLEEIQRENPTEWKVYLLKGALALGQKNFSEAISNFKKVTELQPSTEMGWENLGVSHLSLGDYASASAVLKKALQVVENPKFRLRLLLGISLNQEGKDDEAITVLSDAIKLDSLGLVDTDSKVQAFSTLGIAYDRLKRYKESINSYEEAIKLDPNNALVLNNLAYTLAERGEQLERCLDMARIAVENEPDNGAYLDTMGWIYFKMGKYEEAKVWIEKAVTLGRAGAVVQEHLGDVYLKLGNKEKAMEYWTKALEQDRQSISLQQKVGKFNEKP